MNSATKQKAKDELLALYDSMDETRQAQIMIMAAGLAKDFPGKKPVILKLVRTDLSE